jgi:uncharacterized protein YegJ (DUF2314 family)
MARLYLLAGAFGLLACSADGAATIRRSGNPDVIGVARDDPAMTLAIAKARATAGRLVAGLRDSARSPVLALVKAPFGVGDDVEHMWINDLSVQGRYVRGVVANEPVGFASPRMGDTVQVALVDISDWMLVQDGVLLGGFTLLELRRRMSDSERTQFDATLPYRMAADTAIVSLPHN